MSMPSTEWGFCNPTGTCSVLVLGLWNRANQSLAGSWPAVIPELKLLGGWALSLQHLPITAEAMLPLHVNTENRSAAHNPSSGNQLHSERCPLINVLQNKWSVNGFMHGARHSCLSSGAAHVRKGSLSTSFTWLGLELLAQDGKISNWVLDALVKAHQGHSEADLRNQDSLGQWAMGPALPRMWCWLQAQGRAKERYLAPRLWLQGPLSPAWGRATEDRRPVI